MVLLLVLVLVLVLLMVILRLVVVPVPVPVYHLLLAAFTPATTADVAAKAAVTRDISRLALRGEGSDS